MKPIRIFEWASAWVVATAMFVYGFAKPIQFSDPSTITTPVNELTGMQLMWAFYGYSAPFHYLLGVLEVTGGVLLLIPRTRVLGALLLTAMLSNIIAQDIFYGVLEGALRAAIVYQVLTLGILWMHREAVMDGFRRFVPPREEAPSRTWIQRLWIAAAVIGTAVALKALEILFTHVLVG
jgi:hypothetical protein